MVNINRSYCICNTTPGAEQYGYRERKQLDRALAWPAFEHVAAHSPVAIVCACSLLFKNHIITIPLDINRKTVMLKVIVRSCYSGA